MSHSVRIFCLAAICFAVGGVVSPACARSVESLAKYDTDPDGEIVSQRVTISAEETDEDTVVKTITVTREIRKRPAKKAKGWFEGGDDAEKGKKPAYPPPSATDASEPKRLVRYFCRVWKDEDYKRMYGAMDPKYRKGTDFETFKRLFEADAEANSGLSDENIAETERDAGAAVQLSVTLTFKNKRVKPRQVKALVIKTPDGYRLQESPIIPMDLDDL